MSIVYRDLNSQIWEIMRRVKDVEPVYEVDWKKAAMVGALGAATALGPAAVGAEPIRPKVSMEVPHPDARFIFGVDLEKVKQIESGGNPRAYNRGSGARGLYQITPIVLSEWNKIFPKEQHTLDDLFDPIVNTKIARWYFARLAEHYLPSYRIPVNVDNLLIAYNWGIGHLNRWYKAGADRSRLPADTRKYLDDYHR